MKLNKLIKELTAIQHNIAVMGGNTQKADVCIEAIDDEDKLYYETNFLIFVDDFNNIGLSPLNK